MTPELYLRVALRRDLDEHRLKVGDVAVLIDRVPTPREESGVWCWRCSTPSERRSRW